MISEGGTSLETRSGFSGMGSSNGIIADLKLGVDNEPDSESLIVLGVPTARAQEELDTQAAGRLTDHRYGCCRFKAGRLGIRTQATDDFFFSFGMRRSRDLELPFLPKRGSLLTSITTLKKLFLPPAAKRVGSSVHEGGMGGGGLYFDSSGNAYSSGS